MDDVAKTDVVVTNREEGMAKAFDLMPYSLLNS